MLFAPKAMALGNEEILQRISNLEQEIISLKGMLTSPTEQSQETTSGLNQAREKVEELAVSQEFKENACSRQSVNGSWGYCSVSCPCEIGQGDCNNHLECQSGYCAYDVGLKYGFLKTVDVCEPNPLAKNQPLNIQLGSLQQESLLVKGRALDKTTKVPLSGVLIFNSFTSNKNGIFEIQIDPTKPNNQLITLKKEGYFEEGFSLCQDCWGYERAIVKPPLFNETAPIVFPIFADKLEIGDFALSRANNLKVLSDRFVKLNLEIEIKNGQFFSVFEGNDFAQEKNITNVLIGQRNYRVVLTDKQGKVYISPTYLQADIVGDKLPAVLTFVKGEFLWGLCGNNVCEKEDTLCPNDCQDACFGDEQKSQHQCLFGCQEDACKKDIFLSYPNTETALKENDKIAIEWLQSGLTNHTFDFEILAFDKNNGLVKGFQQIIATSVSPLLGKIDFELTSGLSKENKYKIVVYNKMCAESGELLVTCLKERYLSKSENYFALEKSEKEKQRDSFFQTQVANISQITSSLIEKIQQLLK